MQLTFHASNLGHLPNHVILRFGNRVNWYKLLKSKYQWGTNLFKGCNARISDDKEVSKSAGPYVKNAPSGRKVNDNDYGGRSSRKCSEL
jgi:hypothetical protein